MTAPYTLARLERGQGEGLETRKPYFPRSLVRRSEGQNTTQTPGFSDAA